MIITQVCLKLATIKGHSKICNFTVLVGSENQSVSGVTTICFMQCNTSPSHRVNQVVDCSLWNVGQFGGCAKLLDIGRNWNTLLYTPIQSVRKPGSIDPMTAVVPRVKGFACYSLSFSRHNKNIKMEHFFLLYILSRYFI